MAEIPKDVPFTAVQVEALVRFCSLGSGLRKCCCRWIWPWSKVNTKPPLIW